MIFPRKSSVALFTFFFYAQKGVLLKYVFSKTQLPRKQEERLNALRQKKKAITTLPAFRLTYVKRKDAADFLLDFRQNR